MKCNYCGKIFDECDRIKVREIHTETDPTSVEEWTENLCPYCGNDDLEETFECEVCGEKTAYRSVGDVWLCNECIKDIERIARDAISNVESLSALSGFLSRSDVCRILVDIIEEELL